MILGLQSVIAPRRREIAPVNHGQGLHRAGRKRSQQRGHGEVMVGVGMAAPAGRMPDHAQARRSHGSEASAPSNSAWGDWLRYRISPSACACA